jgi:hypothetical protein
MTQSSKPDESPPDSTDLLLADLYAMRGTYGDDEEACFCEGAKSGLDAAIALVRLRAGR